MAVWADPDLRRSPEFRASKSENALQHLFRMRILIVSTLNISSKQRKYGKPEEKAQAEDEQAQAPQADAKQSSQEEDVGLIELSAPAAGLNRPFPSFKLKIE